MIGNINRCGSSWSGEVTVTDRTWTSGTMGNDGVSGRGTVISGRDCSFVTLTTEESYACGKTVLRGV